MVRPLNHLLNKHVLFVWSPEVQDAFKTFRAASVALLAVLVLLDFTDGAPSFEIWSDASGFGVGAMLMQGGRVFAY